MDNNELWQLVLSQMQFNISKANFATWFHNTCILSKEDEKLVISVPNAFSKEWLSNKYYKAMLKIIHEKDSSVKELEFLIPPHTQKKILEFFVAKGGDENMLCIFGACNFEFGISLIVYPIFSVYAPFVKWNQNKLTGA